MMIRTAGAACLVLALAAGASTAAMAQTASVAGNSTAQTEEAAWPHTITEGGATATINEPQAISWPDLTTLTARAAVSITPAGAKTPFYGTIEMSVATDVDLGTRSVILTGTKLLSAQFPTLDAARLDQIEARIREVMATLPPKHIPLDTILLSLKEQPHVSEVAVKNDPPKIFFSSKPASLVVFDGEPVLAPIAGTTLSFAVNTNWDVFKDADGTWYMLHGASWLSAPEANGPWSPVATLPAAFGKLPTDASFASVRKAVPGKPFTPGSAPAIFVSDIPAEIIVTVGPPKFVPVAGTSLQYVSNTDAALFLDPAGGRFYYLVSGRWFSAAGLDGPWTFATPDLPPDFAKIAANGPNGSVLASVPGTKQAQAALVQAQIPRQATLKRSATVHVVYGGAPRFVPIPGTSIEYAVNTHSEVLRIGNAYYACYQGAWFKSASANGPWVPADSVPAAVYTIPPSSPLYPVTFVRVYGATPQTVTYGYTSGYVMGFVSAGVVAYGTGYYYPPVVVPGPVPAFYPYPYSYAGGVYYNTASGAWARGGTVYGPYGTAARGGTAYNPATGAWATGGAVYGPNGGAGAWSAYNPSTGSYAHGSAAWGNGSGSANASWYNARSGVTGTTNQNANPYERWGSSTLSGPNATVNTRSASDANGSAGAFNSSTGAAGAGVHGKGGNNAGAVKGANGNVYAGADGNVYRHTSDGWSKYNDGSWNSVQKPTQSSTHSPTSTTATRQTATTQQAAATHQSAPRATAPTTAPTHSASSPVYGQLEQDRQARSFGAAQQQRFRGAGSAQGRFGGHGFEGGGRRFR
jgi:hypothetical protein